MFEGYIHKSEKLRPLYFLLFFISWNLFSQELPPVINFDPVEYEAGNQNWMISQASNKKIYIANSEGLLEFNGSEWNLYPVPNNTIVRAVRVVDDKIFTGAYMEMGYWKEDARGILVYTSLTEKFPQKVNDGEQFWHIEHVGETVVVQSFEGIYLYDLEGEEITVLKTPEGAVLNLMKLNGRIYFQISEQGLFTVEKGKVEAVIPDEILGGREVVQVFQFNENLQLLTRQGNFYNWSHGNLEQVSPEISSALAGNSLFSAIQLEDSSYLLGSVENGIYHITPKGKILHHFNQENGIQNNTVLNLFLDREENVWAGLDNGISIINLHSPFRLFQDNVGRIGTVYTSLKKDDLLYLGTNQGLYFKRPHDKNFRFVEGTNGQVWSLQVLNGIVFMGHNNGTFIIDDTKAEKIAEHLGTWTVIGVPEKENLYIQGHYNGFSFLEKKDSGFKEYAMVMDFPHSSKHIVADEDGQIWIGNEHKGVFRIKMDSSLTQIKDLKNYPFTEVIGITSSIFKFDGNLYYASKNEIYQYDSETDNFNDENQLASVLDSVNRISGRMISFGDNVWGFAANSIVNVKASNLDRGFTVEAILIPKELRTIPQGYENISSIDKNTYLLGLVDGYLTFDEISKDLPLKYDLVINRIEKAGLEEDAIDLDLDQEAHLDFKENNINFSFSIPEYKKFVVPFYSYRLKGLSSRWTAWSQIANASFKNLSPGSYTFEVRAKVGNEVSEASYSFEILKPWYFSTLAVLGYFLLFLLLVYLVHRTYKREHLKRIRENEKSLKLKNLEAEQKIIRLQNEQLEKEMAGKSKELAVSTMSLIKKNEFLTSIREKLKDSQENSQVQSVIKTIDKDISEEDNWKFFKKAFNNADKDFFKKIKKQHPELTSNDLKLCAYLRLNLTSKEIAPLLNISVKSVEIKRYRLRKKMDLPHEKNLIDYILEI